MASATENSHGMNQFKPFRMERLLRRIRLGAALAGVALLASSCSSPESRDKWLRFFFDGVPPPPGSTEPTEQPADPAVQKTAALKPEATPVLLPGSIHEPYAEHSCDACHESKFSQQLGGTMREVCFTCHDDFLSAKKFKHYPAKEGDCTECHNPHKSPNKHLLNRTGSDLCYECHDDMTKGAKYKHDPAAKGYCTECHNPHASDHRHLLTRTSTALCTACHDDVTSSGPVKHDPAAEGDCTECHDPHASKNPHLLSRSGSAICYECHDEEDILEVEVHQSAGNADCTTCHDPHAGGEHLLRPNWEIRRRSAGE